LKGKREKTNLRNTSTLFKAQLIRLVDEHVCAHGNVLCISTTVRQTKHGITLFETALALRSEFLDYTAEFDAQSFGGLGRERVVAFALEQVHAVETEGFDADEGLCGGGGRAFDLVDEEGGGGAFAFLDVFVSCQLGVAGKASGKLQLSDNLPTARMLTIVTVIWVFEV
jgi:hypothetical protein